MIDGSRIRALAGIGMCLEISRSMRSSIFGREYGAAADSIRREAEDRLEFPIFREHSFNYDPRFETLCAPKILIGFWQSEKYFQDRCRNHSIRIQVDLRGARRERPMARRSEAGSRRVCSRSAMRLCDDSFGENAWSMLHVLLLSAMEHIRRMVRQPRFFVFSDDLDWVRENFVAPDTVVVDANGPEAADQELRLMSACRHHIIANSSLSWWAAWLGEHESQIVIAPEPWFITGRPTPDLLPDRWLLLPRG
jgi:hypothetical protein